jgi:NAD(P)-dependent dehydrogenase (short-subunit alcohol dehydrogenase family)
VDQATQVIQTHLDKTGQKLWALINNAGLMRGGPIDSMQMSDWELQMQVNVYGMVRMIRGCLPMLREAKGGRIVNIASVAGICATPDTSGYNASKYAVEGLSESLRRELRPWNVDVIVVEPGIMKTNLWDVILSEDAILKQQFDRLSPKLQDTYGRAFFLKKHSASNYLVDFVGGDPQQVVDVLKQTVTRKHPRPIYGVGTDWHLFDLLRKLPVWLADFLIDTQEKWLMDGVKPAALLSRS